MATIFSLSRHSFCLFLSKEPAFCTILPFQFVCQLEIFHVQLRTFTPKTPLFNGYFAPLSYVFNDSKRFCLYHYSVFLCFSASIQHHFDLHLAAFYLAFCTKMPCVLHQNALHLAPKRTTFSGKQPRKRCKWRPIEINIHFAECTC